MNELQGFVVVRELLVDISWVTGKRSNIGDSSSIVTERWASRLTWLESLTGVGGERVWSRRKGLRGACRRLTEDRHEEDNSKRNKGAAA